MKKLLIISVGVILLFAISLSCFLQMHKSDYNLIQNNVEALADNETIVIITCVPEERSLCISYQVTSPIIDSYYSPH